MAWWQWSKTAANNATADSSINWSEGQAPSSINDSGRAMMAVLASYRDDSSGLLATGGTSTAFTVATNQGLAATPTNGQLLSVTPHATNGASATLAADGGTAFAIQTAPGTAVAAGVLVAGTPYDLKFNSSASAWILKGSFANPFNVPLGVVLDYTGTTAPNSNFALANGQAISRTTYAAYFALVGTTFGVGDGTTTFNIPDLSNRVVAGLQMSGTARITVAGGNFDGNVLGTTGGLQNHTMTSGELVAHTHTGTASSSSVTASGTTSTESADHTHSGTTSSDGAHTHTTGQTGSLLTGADTLGGSSPVLSGSATTSSNGAHTHTLTTGGVSATHTHTVTVTGTAAGQAFTTASTGSTTPFSILPPVMVLSKIVRIF